MQISRRPVLTAPGLQTGSRTGATLPSPTPLDRAANASPDSQRKKSPFQGMLIQKSMPVFSPPILVLSGWVLSRSYSSCGPAALFCPRRRQLTPTEHLLHAHQTPSWRHGLLLLCEFPASQPAGAGGRRAHDSYLMDVGITSKLQNHRSSMHRRQVAGPGVQPLLLLNPHLAALLRPKHIAKQLNTL